MSEPVEIPVVRLLPKVPAQKFRFGYPWVFGDEIVKDRRTRAITAGSVVQLQDSDRQDLGLCAFNAESQIICRVLDADITAKIDADWVKAKLQRALELRARLFDAPYYRLVHAEADGLPGVVIDRFGDVAVVQPNTAWSDVNIEMIAQVLVDIVGVKIVVKNCNGRSRVLEGLDDVSAVIRGTIDKPIAVPMNGATYLADVIGGQKTGLFYDQAPNHAFMAKLAKGGTVLDMFSHVGGFGLAALAGGATSVLAVDGSAPSLALAEEGAAAFKHKGSFETRKGDAFHTMAALQEDGAHYDVVVCDPPAFAPNKKALEAGLRAYSRVARHGASLVESGGYLCLCSCSHAADLGKFRDACLRGIGKAGRRAQLIHTGGAGPDHPTHPMLAESSYLKALFFRLD